MGIDIIGKKRLFLAISGILILLSVISLSIKGLNLGVDFTGGSLIRLRFESPVSAAQVMNVLVSQELSDLHLDKAVVQPVKGTSDVQVRAHVNGRPFNDEQLERVLNVLGERLGKVNVVESEMVEPIIGGELLRRALIACIIGSIGILIYVSARFEFKFATAAVIALVHDVLITLGAFSLMGREVNSPFMAAILTILGYSINDTIVVYDKIRENLKIRRRGEGLAELVNRSILETMTRTLNTLITTLLAVVAVYMFGGATIRDFALALIIGLTSGTYSSIFIASSIWLDWKNWEREREKRAALAKA
ncbi:MAG TPA: protein translocase subunit SecF [Firmicutes bacterium]|nr:protein translocase subunit SecF [Bacillota bacterium]